MKDRIDISKLLRSLSIEDQIITSHELVRANGTFHLREIKSVDKHSIMLESNELHQLIDEYTSNMSRSYSLNNFIITVTVSRQIIEINLYTDNIANSSGGSDVEIKNKIISMHIGRRLKTLSRGEIREVICLEDTASCMYRHRYRAENIKTDSIRKNSNRDITASYIFELIEQLYRDLIV